MRTKTAVLRSWNWGAEVLHEQRVLVRRAEPRGERAVKVDNRIVTQRLEEKRSAVRPQDARDLGERLVEVQVVDDGDPTDHIEGLVGEVEALGVHFEELDGVEPSNSRALAGVLDADALDVDAGDPRPQIGEREGTATLAAPVLEHGAAGRKYRKLVGEEAVARRRHLVIALDPRPPGGVRVVKLAFAFVSFVGFHHSVRRNVHAGR